MTIEKPPICGQCCDSTCGCCATHPKPEKQEVVKLGTVIQIMPDHELCAGVLAMVVNTKAWGVEALILVPVRRGEVPKELYIRLEWDAFEIIGESPFQPEIIEPQLIITPPSVRGS